MKESARIVHDEHRSISSVLHALKHLTRLAGGLVLLTWALSAAGQEDAQRGKVMYETHCGGCHYERLHDRARTKIGGLPDLRDEVSRWAPQTGRRFSLDEREDVVQYLNQSHYRFGLAPKADQRPSRTSP